MRVRSTSTRSHPTSGLSLSTGRTRRTAARLKSIGRGCLTATGRRSAASCVLTCSCRDLRPSFGSSAFVRSCAMTDLERLRGLLEDEATDEVEVATGDGSTTVFAVRNPRAADDPTTTVSVDGADLVRGVTFFVTDNGRTITLVPAPPAGAQVIIRYRRQSFTDAELTDYLARAALDWGAGTVGLIYRAGLLALDTLLLGTATAVDFGADSEHFE